MASLTAWRQCTGSVLRAASSVLSRSYAVASAAPRVLLTEEQKAEIRALRAKDPVANSQSKLAKKYNVSGLYIAMVARTPDTAREVSRLKEQIKLESSSARHQIAVLRRRRIRELARTPGERGL